MRKLKFLILISMLSLIPKISFAASAVGDAWYLSGADLSSLWIIPFTGMLLSIALGPILFAKFWHHNYGKISVAWAVMFIVPFIAVYGVSITAYEVIHILLIDYVPFLILLFSLFVISGGIRLKGSLSGSPIVNTLILLIGAILASWMGTTGAAMLLIRPLLRANAHRKYKVHTVIFFIFTVANIGGSLTPVGDPPLFLGFLKGVDFFWTLEHMFLPMLFTLTILFIIYFIMDTILYKKEGKPAPENSDDEKLGLEGSINFLLIAGVIFAVVISGVWKPNPAAPIDASIFDNAPIAFSIYHVPMYLNELTRLILLLILAWLSLKLTRKESRELNGFNWEPILEVGKLFFGIFITMIPALKILQAGESGGLASVVSMISDENGNPVNLMYFWITGILSSFLDNAPTYLVFFTTAAGDVSNPANIQMLMTEKSSTLLAISMGAVFMGANTYIGNAPNFMVRSIAENQGVKMPSFFGYMVWSIAILIPLFLIVAFIFID